MAEVLRNPSWYISIFTVPFRLFVASIRSVIDEVVLLVTVISKEEDILEYPSS